MAFGAAATGESLPSTMVLGEAGLNLSGRGSIFL
jgi:hypothetical protein